MRPQSLYQKGDPAIDHIDNLVWSCSNCNLNKSSAVSGIDNETGQVERLFNPRADVWDDHFVALQSGHIVGLNPVGRTTVTVLRMNDPDKVAGRAVCAVGKIWPVK